MNQKIKIITTLMCSILLLTGFTYTAVLDNFEDGDNGNWWGGYWYTFDDSPNNGDSVVNPLPDAKGGIGFIPSDVTDQPGNNYAARMWGELGGGYQYAFVGMGTNLGQIGDSPAPVNISQYTGVRFKVKGTGTYQFKIVDPNAANRNYKVYLKTFTASSSWQTITVNFNETDLAYGWGNYNNKIAPNDQTNWADKPALSTVLQGVESFQWQTVDQTPGTQVDLWVDDIELIGSGSTLPTKPTSSSSDGLIDDLEDGDAANNLGGYWFTFNDSADGGNTEVNPPQGTDFTPTTPSAGNSSQYAAKFSWTISNPAYINPYAALGTNLTPDGPPSYADGTNTTGIRIKYKSDAHHILKINANVNGVEYPYQVGLPPTGGAWKDVIFGWDEFVLPAWFMQEKSLAGVDAMNNLKLSLNKSKIISIHFQSAPVRYKQGGSGTFEVDDIYSVGGAFAGSGGGGGATTYTLTVNVVGNGTVTKNPDKTAYNAGEQVTLTATPGSGATFVGWSGDATGTNPTITIIMNGNKKITATFTTTGGGTTYTLTVNVSPTGGGTVTKNPNKTSYTAGEQVTLTATPASGYAFVNWTEGTTVLGTDATLSITMNSNRTITANFQQVQAGQYTVTVLINPAGAGTVTKNPNKTSYTAGEQVTLTATANPGYKFSSWSGDATGTNPTTTITVTKNMTVTANFTSTGGGTSGGTTGTVYITDNPVAPGQSVQFRNLKSGDEVKIYNILGQEVTTIKEANGVASWDGKDKNGNPLDSGVYIYKTTKSGAKGKIIVQK